jgi:prepilin-type N-terminal cleavage/methylation domain-containing protein
MRYQGKIFPSKKNGFTLIELLLVVTIIGIVVAAIIPRALRARLDAQYSIIRQDCNEIGVKIMSYAESMAQTQAPGTSFSIKDVLYSDIKKYDNAGFVSEKLVDRYTGDTPFEPVKRLFPGGNMPQNPFNGTSYFAPLNRDISVPSKKPGLIYFAAGKTTPGSDYLDFYLLITGKTEDQGAPAWYGNMGLTNDRLRNGVFVASLYDDKEYGGAEFDSSAPRAAQAKGQ